MGVKGIHPLLSQDTEEGGLKVFFQKSFLNFYKNLSHFIAFRDLVGVL